MARTQSRGQGSTEAGSVPRGPCLDLAARLCFHIRAQLPTGSPFWVDVFFLGDDRSSISSKPQTARGQQ